MEVKLVPPLTNMVKKLLIVFYPWQAFCVSRIENIAIDSTDSTERTAFSLQHRRGRLCLAYSEENEQVLH